MSETNTLITVNSPCMDRLYRINAWRDNNLTISLVQGEGVRIPDDVDNNNPSSITVNGIKAPRFQLCDGSGIINLSNSPQIEWAILRPNGGGEDIVPCNIKDAAQGIIEIPITTSATEYAGHIRGEIRLITDENGAVKFFGIDACVGIGVSDEAAEQSSRFSALLAALQKVVALDAGGEIATLDTVIDGQHTNPVASRVIYNYLAQNYSTTDEMNDAIADAISDIAGLSFQIVETLPAVQDAQSNVIYLVPTEQEGIYTQWVVVNNQWRQIGGTQASGGLKLKKAYETDTPASIVGSNIYENDALDSKTLYQYYNKNGVYIAWMLCAHTPSAMTAQLRFAYDGGIRVRTRSNNVWSKWNLIATKEYTDGKFVDKSRTIAGINLQNDISAAALKTALSVPDVSGKADKATTLSGYGIGDAYTKNETDNKISTAIAGISNLHFEVVQSLPPIQGAYSNIIYLVPKVSTEQNDLYDEWAAVNNQWEHLGTTQIDISGKQDKQTNVPEVPTTEYHGSLIVDTSSSEFLALSIGHLFHSEFSEVLHTYQKTGADGYVELSYILYDGDLPENVSAFTNDAGYITQHQDISGKMAVAPITTYSGDSQLTQGQFYINNGEVILKHTARGAAGHLTLEDKANKTNLISPSSTNSEYPSALAVKNYVDTVIGGIENGSY